MTPEQKQSIDLVLLTVAQVQALIACARDRVKGDRTAMDALGGIERLVELAGATLDKATA